MTKSPNPAALAAEIRRLTDVYGDTRVMASRDRATREEVNADAEILHAEIAQLQTLADDAESSRDFYKRRVDLLQAQQSRMRDPERTIVCDIIANAQMLPDADGSRYGLATAPQGEAVATLNVRNYQDEKTWAVGFPRRNDGSFAWEELPVGNHPLYAAPVAAQQATGKQGLQVAPSAGGTPAGWVMVPVDLTEEMHANAVRAIVRCTGNDDFPPRLWVAMLAAAPTPPEWRKPLTDWELVDLYNKWNDLPGAVSHADFVRMVEAHHGITAARSGTTSAEVA
jgi:hypothetical protein